MSAKFVSDAPTLGPGAVMIVALDRGLSAIERPAAVLSAFVLFGMMLIVAVDVAMRYVFNDPFAWSHDVISLYLLPAVFYLALSRTFDIHGHIGVDILQYSLSDRWRRLCQIAIGLLGAGLFVLIAWLGFERTVEEYADGSAISGLIEWSTWISVAFVPLGSLLISVRLVIYALLHAIALIFDERIVELPPLAGSEESLLEAEA
ncbi:MAG TPA: TRAP transporter small permease subunit [Nitrobacter sp.]|nr:TRAP transporter small permease subunit [Nitrobacter sp.]